MKTSTILSLFTSILLLITAQSVCAQKSNTLDSLFFELDKNIEKGQFSDSLIYDIISISIQKSAVMRMGSYLSVFDSLQHESDDSFFIQKIHYANAHYLMNHRKQDQAITLMKEYVNYFIRQNPPQYPVDAYFYIGRMCSTKKRHNEAIYYLVRAKDHAQKKHLNWIPLSCIALGTLYRKLNYHDKAINEYQYILQNPDLHIVDKLRTYIYITDTYFELSNIDSARHYSNILLAECNRPNLLPFGNRAKLNLAKCAFLENDCSTAIDLALPLSTFYTDNNQNVLGVYLHREILGHCYYQLGDYRLSEKYANNYYKLTHASSVFKSSEKALRQLAISQKALNKNNAAVRSLELLSEVKDSIYKYSLKEKILDLSAEHQVEMKEEEIELLNSQNEVTNLKYRTARNNSIFGLLAALGLGIISFLLFKSLKSKRKSEQLLSDKNEIISSSLAEKELLLKEIHHRVKNNLQVVSSLLSLQSEYISDDSALSAINEGRNRVRSMALIHQNLYSEDNLTGINVKNYLEKLIEGLFDSYNINPENINLVMDITDIDIDVDTLVPLGLIANELVSNALKHAFKDRDRGTIWVSLSDNDKEMNLTVRDDGRGIDPNINLKESESFGYQMIDAFKEKLDAQLIIEAEGGANIQLVLPKSKIHV